MMRILSFAFACLLATVAAPAADDTDHGFEGLKLGGAIAVRRVLRYSRVGICIGERSTEIDKQRPLCA